MEFLGSISSTKFVVPMVGTKICAGFPSPADDFLDEAVDLGKILIPNKAATFLWRVSGRSMVDAGIFDDDVVVVDRSVTPKHGDVVVASINGAVSLKLYQDRSIVEVGSIQQSGGVRKRLAQGVLAFANRSMPTFTLDEAADVEVWGVVTWTLHRPKLP